MNAITILRILLIAFTVVFATVFFKDLVAHKDELKGADRWLPLFIIGLVTDFFDTWGIGCFATTQAGFKFTKTCPDAEMPGTLVISVAADPDDKIASVIVPDYQLSLAIGKEGQNARLAARLTGFKIDIKSESQAIASGELPENYMELSEGVFEEEYEEYDEDSAVEFVEE